jgi:tape measure domain-containing protein
MSLEIEVRSNTRQAEDSLKKLLNTIDKIPESANKSTAQLSKFADNVSKDLKAVNGNLEKSSQALNSTIKNLGTFARVTSGLVTGLLAAGGITSFNKTFVNLGNQIALTTGRTKDLRIQQQRLFAVAQRSNAGLQATVALYSSLVLNANRSRAEAEGLTETLLKAGKLGGGSVDTINSSLIQLQQGLASGVLRGEELNSVLEGTPRIAQAIAAELGVGVGQLRKLAEEGKITADVVQRSMVNAKDRIDKEFKTLQLPIAEAFSSAGRDFAIGLNQLVGTFSSGGAISRTILTFGKAIRETLEDVALNIRTLRVSFLLFRLDFEKNAEALKNVVGKTFGRLAKQILDATSGLFQIVSVFANWAGKVGAVFYDLYMYVVGNSIYKDMIREIIDFSGNIFGALKPLTDFAGKVASVFYDMYMFVIGNSIYKDMIREIIDYTGTIGEALKPLNDYADAVGKLFSKLFTNITGMVVSPNFRKLFRAITGGLSTESKALKRSIIRDFNDVAFDVSAAYQDMSQSAIKTISELFNKSSKEASSFFEQSTKALKNFGRFFEGKTVSILSKTIAAAFGAGFVLLGTSAALSGSAGLAIAASFVGAVSAYFTGFAIDFDGGFSNSLTSALERQDNILLTIATGIGALVSSGGSLFDSPDITKAFDFVGDNILALVTALPLFLAGMKLVFSGLGGSALDPLGGLRGSLGQTLGDLFQSRVAGSAIRGLDAEKINLESELSAVKESIKNQRLKVEAEIRASKGNAVRTAALNTEMEFLDKKESKETSKLIKEIQRNQRRLAVNSQLLEGPISRLRDTVSKAVIGFGRLGNIAGSTLGSFLGAGVGADLGKQFGLSSAETIIAVLIGSQIGALLAGAIGQAIFQSLAAAVQLIIAGIGTGLFKNIIKPIFASMAGRTKGLLTAIRAAAPAAASFVARMAARAVAGIIFGLPAILAASAALFFTYAFRDDSIFAEAGRKLGKYIFLNYGEDINKALSVVRSFFAESNNKLAEGLTTVRDANRSFLSKAGKQFSKDIIDPLKSGASLLQDMLSLAGSKFNELLAKGISGSLTQVRSDIIEPFQAGIGRLMEAGKLAGQIVAESLLYTSVALFASLGSFLSEKLIKPITNIFNSIDTLLIGLDSAFKALVISLGNDFVGVVNTIVSNISVLISSIENAFVALGIFVSEKLVEVLSTLFSNISLLSDTLETTFRVLTDSIKDTLLGTLESIPATIESIASALETTITETLTSLPSQLKDSLVSALGSAKDFFGMSDNSGSVQKFNTGGSVWGAGTGTSDSIPAMLSNGEFVIKEKVAKQNRGLLEQLNQTGKIPKFADGGPIGRSSSAWGKLAEEEGYRSKVYIDSQGFPTIGYGELLEKKKMSLEEARLKYGNKTLTKDQAADWSLQAINSTFLPMSKAFVGGEESWKALPQAAGDTVLSMAYNLGQTGLEAFKGFQKAVKGQDFNLAGYELMDSDAASQAYGRYTGLMGHLFELGGNTANIDDAKARKWTEQSEAWYDQHNTRRLSGNNFKYLEGFSDGKYTYDRTKPILNPNQQLPVMDGLSRPLKSFKDGSMKGFIKAQIARVNNLTRSIFSKTEGDSAIPKSKSALEMLIDKAPEADNPIVEGSGRYDWLQKKMGKAAKSVKKAQDEKKPRFFNNGGSVWGEGTATSDSIPAMLSNGEFVIKESVARNNRSLLTRLNDTGNLPKFREGGFVGDEAFGGGATATRPPGYFDKFLTSIENVLGEDNFKSLSEAMVSLKETLLNGFSSLTGTPSDAKKDKGLSTVTSIEQLADILKKALPSESIDLEKLTKALRDDPRLVTNTLSSNKNRERLLAKIEEIQSKNEAVPLEIANELRNIDADLVTSLAEVIDASKETSSTLKEISPALLQIASTASSNFKSDLTGGVSGLLKGEQSPKDFALGLVDSFTSNVIDSFSAGLVEGLFTDTVSGGLDSLFQGTTELGSDIGSMAGGGLDVLGTSAMPMVVTIADKAASLFGGEEGEGGIGSEIADSIPTISTGLDEGAGDAAGVGDSVEAGGEKVATGLSGVFSGFLDSAQGTFGSIFGGLGSMLSGLFSGGGSGGGLGGLISGGLGLFFHNGGLVPDGGGFHKLNGGEMVLTAAQQQELYSQAKGSTQSKSSQQNISINVTGDISNQTKKEVMMMIPGIASGVNQHNRENTI